MFKDDAPPCQDEDTPYPNVRRRTRPGSIDRTAAPIHGAADNRSDSFARDPNADAHTDAGVMPPAGEPAYDVGYAKPPKHTRFRKGQSGNPKGRPRGAKSAATIATTLLEAKVKAKIDGATKMVSALEVSLQQQLKKAMGGDAKAFQFLLSLHEKAAPTRSLSGGSSGESDPALTDTEQAILAHHQRNNLLAQGLDEAKVAAVLRSMGLGDSEGEQS